MSSSASNGTSGATAAKENVSPRVPNCTVMETPLDFSFLSIISPKDMLSEEPRGNKKRKVDEKYHAKCLKLNNNHIQDASTLMEVAVELIFNPEAITWIDLSFNNLQKIDPVFCQFQSLQILYLHGNQIDDISEVDKLAQIKTLKKLALHGNAIETTKHYRFYVLFHCRQLVNFDMSTVSNAERETAKSLIGSSQLTSKKKKKTADD